jgi:hypothetical protein
VDYDVGLFGPIIAVIWRRVPTSESLEHLLKEVERIHDKQQRRLMYLAVAPRHVDVPEGMQRHALSAFGRRASPFCESANLVLEGDGFKSALQRSAVTAMYFLKGGPTKVTVFASVGEAAVTLASRSGIPLQELKAKLEALRAGRHVEKAIAAPPGLAAQGR